MNTTLATAVFWAGFGQFSVLIASALVPLRLDWRNRLASLPILVRQLFWVYGGYVVLSIVSLAAICVIASEEISSGSLLARCFCAYAALFWGIRLSLQPFLAVKPFLSTWWLVCGYHLLTVLFTSFTTIFIWGLIH